MKLVTYYFVEKDKDQAAILAPNGLLYNLNELDSKLPDTMLEFLMMEDAGMVLAKAYNAKIENNEPVKAKGKKVDPSLWLSPLPTPNSLRDAYAFKEHVETARKNRGLEMIPEYDLFPVFYFGNHNSVQGPGIVECQPDHLQQLDFELEIAIIIGKEGKNIKAEDAHEYIAGYTIMNDLSARKLQMDEMKLNLGPAKGKDFCTVLGPYIVTPDELKNYLCEPQKGHKGNNYNLQMEAWVNNKLISKGNMASMQFTFAEIIERASYGTYLYPGDVIGSGTVGTGCLLEINGTEKRKNPAYQPVWLEENDQVTLKISALGEQSVVIALPEEEEDFAEYSII